MYNYDLEIIIKNLLKELNLKNEVELATKLDMSKNALSMLKKRNSLGTLIEKILFHIDEKISLDAIIYGNNSNCFKAYEIASKYESLDEFDRLLKNFIETKNILTKIKTIIEKVKGQTFFQKFLEQFTNEGERKLKLLYYFLEKLEEKEKLFNLTNIKSEFISELKKFELDEKIKKFLSYELKEKDKLNLIKWVNEELDEVAIFEIINNISKLKEIINNNLNIIDRLIVKF